jgi:dTDP-4-dehydrorhamnose 3,5-epimerase
VRKVDTCLDDLFLLVPNINTDSRGFFYESYSKKTMNEAGLEIEVIQENQSFNKHKNTFRGLHCQQGAGSQTSLVRVLSGAVRDFAVDLRATSKTYGKFFSCVLSAENQHQIFIPRGFLHGFLTLTDDVDMLYKMDNVYQPECEVFLNVFDPFFGIDLGVPKECLSISDRDKNAPFIGVTSFKF